MNDRQLAAFLAIANSGSISRAARYEFMSHQSLNYQLATLEDELGYQLFERSKQGVTLTSAGRAFKPKAEQILRLFRDAVGFEGEDGGPREVLRISLRSDAGTMILAQICERFSQVNPEVDMRFVPLSIPEQMRDIRTGAFDIMESPIHDALTMPGIGFVGVLSSPNVCLVRLSDPLARKKSVRIEDLHGRRVCVQDMSKCRAAGQLRSLLEREHPQVELVNLGYDAAQITIASLTDVVVVAPRAFARNNVNPAAQVLVPLEGAPPVEIGLVHAGDRPMPVVQKFIDLALSMREELGE